MEVRRNVAPVRSAACAKAKATIASAVQMGVKIKMVTGDQIAIARETSKQLGLGSNILAASSLGDLKKMLLRSRPRPLKARMACAGLPRTQVSHY